MRPKLTGLVLAFGVLGLGDLALGSVYVPGQIRDGFYIRPHFVSAPKQGRWPKRSGEPGAEAPPLLVPAPENPNPLGQAS